MPKILKQTKKAIQSRQRSRLYRGIRSIMMSDAVPQVTFTKKLKQTFSEEITSNERPSLTYQTSLSNKLRNWAIEKNINKRALTALLKILRSCGFALPKDSRTLLETPRKVEIVNLAGGKYWHNGLEHCLTQVFSKLSSNLCVRLNINIDGLPLFKSSPITFWPILANVYGNIPVHSIMCHLFNIYQLRYINLWKFSLIQNFPKYSRWRLVYGVEMENHPI